MDHESEDVTSLTRDVPTYANCACCDALLRSAAAVRVTVGHGYDYPQGDSRIAAWVPCNIPGHYRPLCRNCNQKGIGPLQVPIFSDSPFTTTHSTKGKTNAA